MLEQLKAMETAENWAGILAMEPKILSTLQGDDLARGLLSLSKALEETAMSPAEYRVAAVYACRSADVAMPGSFIHTWSSARAAAMLADVGRFARARQYADDFLNQVDQQPRAAVMAPWALFAAGRALYYARQSRQAVAWFRRAIAAGAPDDLRERIQLFLAWAMAAAGDVTGAFAAIPLQVEHVHHGHVLAATARVCLAAGDWTGAEQNAKCALRAYDDGAMPCYDFVQAAELYLILKAAATAMGRADQAIVRLNMPAALTALGSLTLVAVLALTLGMKGGEAVDAASSVRGDADGHKRTGLRGTVG